MCLNLMRCPSHRRMFFMICLLALLPLGLTTFQLQAEESAEVLVQKMVSRDKELVRHRALYTYTAGETREKLDDDSKVISSSYEEVKVRGDKSPDYKTRSNKGMEAD